MQCSDKKESQRDYTSSLKAPGFKSTALYHLHLMWKDMALENKTHPQAPVMKSDGDSVRKGLSQASPSPCI